MDKSVFLCKEVAYSCVVGKEKKDISLQNEANYPKGHATESSQSKLRFSNHTHKQTSRA